MFIHQSLHYIKTILYIILRMYYIWWKTVFDKKAWIWYIAFSLKTELFLFYNDLQNISTTYINISHLRWYQLKAVIDVGGSQRTGRKAMCSSNPHALLHTTNDDHWDCAWVAAVRIKWIVHCTTWNATIYSRVMFDIWQCFWGRGNILSKCSLEHTAKYNTFVVPWSNRLHQTPCLHSTCESASLSPCKEEFWFIKSFLITTL